MSVTAAPVAALSHCRWSAFEPNPVCSRGVGFCVTIGSLTLLSPTLQDAILIKENVTVVVFESLKKPTKFSDAADEPGSLSRSETSYMTETETLSSCADPCLPPPLPPRETLVIQYVSARSPLSRYCVRSAVEINKDNLFCLFSVAAK